MDAYDPFRYSEAARVHVRGTYKRPDSLAAILPATLSQQACVKKQAGSLDFTIDAGALGWPAPFDFTLNASTSATFTWGSFPLLNWDLSQLVGKDFVAPNGANVTIESVEAKFGAAIVSRATYEAAVGQKFEPPGGPCAGASGWQDFIAGGVFFFGGGPTWVFRTVVDGRPELVELAISQIWLDIGELSLGPSHSVEALLSHIIFGARLDNPGVVIGGPGLPPGPLPFRQAMDDVLVGLATAGLAAAVHDSAARRRLQVAAVETARISLDRMLAAAAER
jgi:hypothetical protein